MIDFEHCKANILEGDTNDCTVVACAVAAQIDYLGMREYLKGYGRETGHGLRPSIYHAALRDLGVTVFRLHGPQFKKVHRLVEGHDVWTRHGGHWVEEHYRATRVQVAKGVDYNAKTVLTLARELREGTYLVGTDRHVLCLKDGRVHDWTEGRRFRVTSVHKVTL